MVLVKPAPIEDVLDAMRRLLADHLSPGGRSAGAAKAATASDEPGNRRARFDQHHRTTLSKARSRFTTTTPPASPPRLVCPSCDGSLKYERSHVGGVSDRHPEQWDYYVCSLCGPFQFRHRTRKLRPVSSGEDRH